MRQAEGRFKQDTLEEIRDLFDGCIILQGNAEYTQGIPDVLVLFNRRWAALEFKRSADASHQPNQDYYVDLMDRMSFAAFIYPENKGDVLHALQRSFRYKG